MDWKPGTKCSSSDWSSASSGLKRSQSAHASSGVKRSANFGPQLSVMGCVPRTRRWRSSAIPRSGGFFRSRIASAALQRNTVDRILSFPPRSGWRRSRAFRYAALSPERTALKRGFSVLLHLFAAVVPARERLLRLRRYVVGKREIVD